MRARLSCGVRRQSEAATALWIVGPKLIPQHFAQYKGMVSAENQKICGEKKAHEVVLTSSTARATLAALTIPRISRDLGTKKEAKDFWKQLYEFYLLPKISLEPSRERLIVLITLYSL
jgi:hypothetical protein